VNSLRLAFLTAPALVGLLAGCGLDDTSDDGVVYPTVSLEVTSGALAPQSNELRSANGTYGAGCTQRTGAWSLLIDQDATLANPKLSVVKGNAACVLTLTSLTSDHEYPATPKFAISDSYQIPSSAFSMGSSPVAFYANAKLSSVAFTSNFIVSILYSDDPNKGTSSNTATYSVVTASAAATNVPSPTYTLSLTPLLVQTDNAKIVQTATGTADLTDGSTTGQRYVVLTQLAGTPTYADMDTAYKAGTSVAMTGANPKIDASVFTLVGLDLTAPKVRYLIIANIVSSVPSYQLYTITFKSP
jgi:hypothetical protein